MNDDALGLTVVLLVLAAWGAVAFRRWLRQAPGVKAPEESPSRRPRDDVAQLLAEHGYEVTHGKRKVNIGVLVDDKELGSSLFVDYFARRDGRVYVVKVARTRKPLDLAAGSAVREQLLPFALLYDDAGGVLYVDMQTRQVHQIRFELEL
ncbi:hypothetical protein [Paenibacillus sp.]|uniref:hypothetical protein n=1 Tax=Paenibacillus sp. TaxID=58172 RepID=UPI002D6D3A90|nr:hypothetical protein [Paenibacillus sp.]HZG85135.1 hypothetical protein [Paenibacillus sp.]